jgi:hypothetical protein
MNIEDLPEVQEMRRMINDTMSRYDERVTLIGDVKNVRVEDMFNLLFDNIFVHEGIKYLFHQSIDAKTPEKKLQIIQHRNRYETLRVLRFLEASNGFVVLPAS